MRQFPVEEDLVALIWQRANPNLSSSCHLVRHFDECLTLPHRRMYQSKASSLMYKGSASVGRLAEGAVCRRVTCRTRKL